MTLAFYRVLSVCRRGFTPLLWLAVAGMQFGCLPSSSARAVATAAAVQRPALLKEVAAERGLAFRHETSRRTPLTIVETMGSGCAFLDYDHDGWQDVLLISAGQDFQQGRQTPNTRLFRNEQGSYMDVTEAAGLTVDLFAMGCCAGDYDNDGWTDLFITGFGRNLLLQNTGKGGFRDVTAALGISALPDAWGMGCAFLDADRDGWLDLYTANYVVYDPAIPLCRSGAVMTGCTPNQYRTQRNLLYVNERGSRFRECAVALGADDPAGAGLGVAVSDFDDDGWPDVFVANDGTPNALLHNRRGRFSNEGQSSGVAFAESGVMRAGMGCDVADYDGDGQFDLVITNFQHEPNSLYRNTGKLTFEETTGAAGIATPSIMRLGFGISFADLDGDGRADLYVGNGHVFDNVQEFDDTASFEQTDQVFLNVESRRFEEQRPETGAIPATPSVARGLAIGDYNNDGAPDVLVNALGRPARLLENQTGNGGQWLGLVLVGSRSNRSAIGARVELHGAGALQVREVRSGGSYLSQSDFRPLFRFGRGVEPAQITLKIRWPGGRWQTVKPKAVGRYITIEEPSSREVE